MKVLIVKTSALGDIVHCFPVVQYLKEKQGVTQIDWVVEEGNRSLVLTHPLVDRVITVNTKAWRKGKSLSTLKQFLSKIAEEEYDFVFDLQGNLKSGLITWRAKAPVKVGFSYQSVPEWPNLLFTNSRYALSPDKNIRDDYLEVVMKHFEDQEAYHPKPILLTISDEEKQTIERIISHNPRHKVMVCPGSAWKNKQVSPEALIAFLKKVSKDFSPHFFFVWGSDEEKVLCQKMQKNFPSTSTVLERVSLPVLQNLMDRMDLIVAMDSLPLHLAGMTSAKTLGVFGPSSLEKYGPTGKGRMGLQGSCPYGETFNRRCSKLRTCPTGACIKDITADSIYEALSHHSSQAH